MKKSKEVIAILLLLICSTTLSFTQINRSDVKWNKSGSWYFEKGHWNFVKDTSNIKMFDAPISPGMYLIKARNQILTGIALQIVGGVIICTSDSNNMNAQTSLIISGGLGILGFIFEIVGINNIGKAGIALNKNGIGIKVKF